MILHTGFEYSTLISAATLVTSAAVTAAAAYLDAKLHLREDIWTIWQLKKIEREYNKNRTYTSLPFLKGLSDLGNRK